MPFFLWLLFSFFMFPRLIHADVCAVHSSEICIVFHCVTMPQLIRPFFCPRAFGFFQVFFFFSLLFWKFCWEHPGYLCFLEFKHTTSYGVYTLQWSYWVKLFFWEVRPIYVSLIRVPVALHPLTELGGVLPLSSSIPNLGYLCWWPWGTPIFPRLSPWSF